MLIVIFLHYFFAIGSYLIANRTAKSNNLKIIFESNCSWLDNNHLKNYLAPNKMFLVFRFAIKRPHTLFKKSTMFGLPGCDIILLIYAVIFLPILYPLFVYFHYNNCIILDILFSRFLKPNLNVPPPFPFSGNTNFQSQLSFVDASIM